MGRDVGRRVRVAGRWYIWTHNESGALSLVSIDRINDGLREIREALATSPGTTG